MVTAEQHGWCEGRERPGGDEKQADTQCYVSVEVSGHSLVLETLCFVLFSSL